MDVVGRDGGEGVLRGVVHRCERGSVGEASRPFALPCRITLHPGSGPHGLSTKSRFDEHIEKNLGHFEHVSSGDAEAVLSIEWTLHGGEGSARARMCIRLFNRPCHLEASRYASVSSGVHGDCTRENVAPRVRLALDRL